MSTTNRMNKKHVSMSRKRRVSNTFIYIILVLMTVIWLVPFICILLESFRVESTYPVGYVIPKNWGFDNYFYLWKDTDFKIWYSNTLIVGVVVAIVQTLIVLLTSYAFSRMRFKGRKGLMNFILVIGMFPGFITMIVLFKVLSGLNLTNENAIYGLMIVYTASSGMGYYIAKGFFDTFPRALDEAARVDGATRFQVFYKIILPLSKPIIIYTILTAFMAPWGDFMFAKYISHATSRGMTVAVGMQNMIGTGTSLAANYTKFCAGGVLVAIPITVLFMLLQKYYVEGVTGGSVKG